MRFPNEIYLQIIGDYLYNATEANDIEALASLSLVNHLFREQTIPFLFREVRIGKNAEHALAQFEGLSGSHIAPCIVNIYLDVLCVMPQEELDKEPRGPRSELEDEPDPVLLESIQRLFEPFCWFLAATADSLEGMTLVGFEQAEKRLLAGNYITEWVCELITTRFQDLWTVALGSVIVQKLHYFRLIDIHLRFGAYKLFCDDPENNGEWPIEALCRDGSVEKRENMADIMRRNFGGIELANRTKTHSLGPAGAYDINTTDTQWHRFQEVFNTTPRSTPLKDKQLDSWDIHRKQLLAIPMRSLERLSLGGLRIYDKILVEVFPQLRKLNYLELDYIHLSMDTCTWSEVFAVWNDMPSLESVTLWRMAYGDPWYKRADTDYGRILPNPWDTYVAKLEDGGHVGCTELMRGALCSTRPEDFEAILAVKRSLFSGFRIEEQLCRHGKAKLTVEEDSELI